MLGGMIRPGISFNSRDLAPTPRPWPPRGAWQWTAFAISSFPRVFFQGLLIAAFGFVVWCVASAIFETKILPLFM